MTPAEHRILKKQIAAYMSNLNKYEILLKHLSSERGGLLSPPRANTKTMKGLSKYATYNYTHNLLPADYGGVNLCPSYGACILNCLFTSGKSTMLKSKQIKLGLQLSDSLKCMAERTWLYQNHKDFYLELLWFEITRKNRIHREKGQVLQVRLNTFSDIDWTGLIQSLPTVKFYDYTKVWNREPLPNYHLTYSFSEMTARHSGMKIANALDSKMKTMNVAVVFEKAPPKEWYGYPVIDGDDSDNRYDDPRGVIVGLHKKTTLFATESRLFV